MKRVSDAGLEHAHERAARGCGDGEGGGYIEGQKTWADLDGFVFLFWARALGANTDAGKW